MLVPVIGFMQVGGQARADRYTYLPQIGLYLMVAWGAPDLCGVRPWARVGVGCAAAAILAALLASAYVQTTFWKDSLTLWTHTLACTSDNYMAHNNWAPRWPAKASFHRLLISIGRRWRSNRTMPPPIII